MRCLIPLVFALACLQAGCQLISQAQRDDDEEWSGSWGSEDGTGGQDDKQVRKKMVPPSPAARATEGRPGVEAPKVARAEPARAEPAPAAAPVAEPAPEPAPEPEAEPKPRPKPRRKPKPRPKPKPKPKPEPLPPPPEVAPELDRPSVEEPPDPNAPVLEEPPAPAPVQAPPARPVTPAPERALTPEAPAPTPAPPVKNQAVDSEPNIVVSLDGGILVERGGRIEPAAGLGLGWNLGKLLGWSGLYLEADVDTFFGQSPLGAEYVMLDTGLGFTGRFGLGPVTLMVGLEFVLRDMFITKTGASTSGSDTQFGFGAGAGVGLGVPLTDWLDLHVGADGRYARQPLTNRFEFTAVVSGGVGFSF